MKHFKNGRNLQQKVYIVIEQKRKDVEKMMVHGAGTFAVINLLIKVVNNLDLDLLWIV